MLKLLILALFVYAAKSISSLNPKLDLTDDRDSSITKKIPCIQRICSKYFSSKYKLRGSLVIVNFPRNNIDYTDILLKTFNEDHPKSTLMTKNANRPHLDPRHVTEKAKNYFMIVNRSYEIIDIIKQLQSLPTWNSLAEILVWLLPHNAKIELHGHNEIVESFNLLLNASMINAHLMYSMENSDKINVLTWYPYGHGNCADRIEPIQKVSECEFIENKLVEQDFVNATDPAKVKIPKQLNNCTFKVSATNWIPFSAFTLNRKAYGIETSLVRLIARKLGLNPVFINRNTNRANTIISNNTYAELLDKKVQIMIGGLDENAITRKLLSSSISYFEDDITWCVRIAQPKPTFENVFVIFKLPTWVLTFAMALIAGVMLFCFHKHDIVKKPHYDISWALLLSYAVTLSCPGNYFPQVTYLRIFFIALVLYGIHINIAYHSKLISFLTKPRYETQVSSLDVAINKRFVLAGGIANLEPFKGTSDVSKYVTEHLKICTNIDECFEEVRNIDNYAVAISRTHAINLNLTENEYYCFPRINNVYPFSISMLFQRQHHLLDKFNKIIRRCMEAGLINRWIDQAAVLNKRHVIKPQETEEYVVLTLDHVQGAFILWSIGISLSILIFVVERFHPKYNNIKKMAKSFVRQK